MLCDEPESGIHERCVASVLDYLGSIDSDVVIASHHPRALTRADFHVVHVDRASDGVTLRPPIVGDDLAETAHRLVVLPLDLLAMKRLMIIVEGSHDETVVRRLVSRSGREFTESRVLVAPVRGVKNVASIASSEVLVSFTQTHFLVVTDNTRTEPIRRVLERASELQKPGRKPSQIIVESGLEKLNSDASPEERYVLDLARRVIEHRVLDRLRVFGLSVPDVIDLLPPKSFGLDEDWPSLRNDYRASRDPGDFKSWLCGTRGASISIQRIRAAMDSLDELPDELRSLFDEIEIAVDIAALT